MKLRATIRKDSKGRLTQVQVRRGKYQRGITLEYVYGADGYVQDILFRGKKEQMPNFPQIIDLINESFVERVSTIETITKISDSVEVDHTKIKGVALKDPTVAESVPTSIENTAIAYDVANDRFKVDVESIVDVEVVQPTAADLKATVTQAEKDRTVTCDTAANLKATVTQESAERTLPHLSTADLRDALALGVGADQAVVTVAAGNKAIIYGYTIVNNDASNVGNYNLYLGASTTPLYSGKIPCECPVLKTFVHPVEGANNEDIKITITGSTDTDVIIFADVVAV